MILSLMIIINYCIMKKLSTWISTFSFFEFTGAVTFGIIISNYFLDKPLINIRIFFACCLIGSILSMFKLCLNYKKFMGKSEIKK